MFQSGSLVTYQAAQSLHRSAYYGQSSRHPTATQGLDYLADFVASDLVGLPYPATIDEATAYPTAKQWDAKHGAYVIPRLTSFDSDFMSPLAPDDGSPRRAVTGSTNHPTAWTQDSKVSVVDSGIQVYLTQVGFGRLRDIPGGWDPSEYGVARSVAPTMPYTTTGIHLSGLAPESTFTLVATWYIQLCPLPHSGLSTMV